MQAAVLAVGFFNAQLGNCEDQGVLVTRREHAFVEDSLQLAEELDLRNLPGSARIHFFVQYAAFSGKIQRIPPRGSLLAPR